MEDKVIFIDRESGEKKEEAIYFESALRFLYGSFLGKSICKIIATLPLFSHLMGKYQRLSITKKNIQPFVQKYGVNETEMEQKIEEFASFDAFFTRKLKPGIRPMAAKMVIPADGRYLVYPNCEEVDGFVVKGKKFTLNQLLGSAQLAERYRRGALVIARLAPSDYHRFHFPIECVPGVAKLINGPLYSVSPISLKQKVEVLAENKRMITSLKTENYGTILFIEIGATNVGSIHQTFQAGQQYKKGDEKGYFSFGGSSIILLFEEGVIQFSNDLLKNSSQHIETLCQFGQTLEN